MNSLSEGYRSDLGAVVHDVDEGHCVFDFSTRDDHPDAYHTTWSSHVFRDSFRRRPHIPMLFDHGLSGYPAPIGSSVRCESLPDKARVVNKFARTPMASDVRSLLLDGHIPGASFHYARGVTQPHPTMRGYRRFLRADMLESSPVLRPSSPHNSIAGVRSMVMRDGIDLEDLARMVPLARFKVLGADETVLSRRPAVHVEALELRWHEERALRLEVGRIHPGDGPGRLAHPPVRRPARLLDNTVGPVARLAG